MNETVLIVDDSLTVRMDLMEAFTAAGFKALVCGTLAEAREVLSRDAVDVVVLDILLPDGDGIELLRALRASETFLTMPVLVLSTEVEVKDRVRGIRTGANEYVGKPYDTGHVVARACELVRVRRSPAPCATCVLVIDDSTTYLEALRTALEARGYEVIGAASGEEGLLRAAERRPDAMIVDGVLPGMDGATVIRRVRLDVALRGVPCILITGAEAEGGELRALDSGADDFIRKHQDIDVIVAKLDATLRRSTVAAFAPGVAGFLGPQGPRKILAVDDSPQYLEVLADTLRGEGYDVACAGSGEEALELLAVQPVDCVLLDLQMPGMGGEEMCRRVKAASGTRHIPLIMLSILDDHASVIRGLGSGADDYVSKSSDFETLKARLRAQIRRKQFEDENRRIRATVVTKELEAAEAQAARELAALRAALVEDLERKNRELLEAKEFLNNVLESSTEHSIIAVNLDGMVLTWNEGAHRNYGYTAEAMVGRQNSYILNLPEDIESGKAASLFDAALRTGKSEGVFERVRMNGQHFTASVLVSLRRDAAGAPIGFVVISRDITETKRLEDRLRRKNEELEEQNWRIQEVSRLKSEFLANMSHELRTPLNAIIGFTEILHDGRVGGVTPTQEEFLGDILSSGRHLLQLINQVLDLAQVESGKLEFHPEPVDLGELVGEVRDALRALFASRRVRLDIDITLRAPVITDPSKLKQVLFNYVSNALKFTNDGGHVTVRVGPEGAERFQLSVEDDGIGILPGDLARLFVEFHQLDAGAAKKYAGTGLGLALTRKIVEAQGGYVGVRSTPGQGSTFFAVLPIAPLPGSHSDGAIESSSTEPIAASTSAEPLRQILIVEDDPAPRTWLAEALERAGYSVTVAADGRSALEISRTRRFDAMTIDLLLPDMTGWDVLRALRSGGINREVHAIVATGLTDKLPSTGLGVRDILTKPIDLATLLRMLRRAGLRVDGERSVLIVDSDPRAVELVAPMLLADGYRVTCRPDASSGLEAAADEHPDVVVMEWTLRDEDGHDFLRRLRDLESGRQTPVILWTDTALGTDEREALLPSAQAVVPKSDLISRLVDEVRLHAPLQCAQERSDVTAQPAETLSLHATD